MATGDGVQVSGAYATVQASTASITDGSISGGAVTNITTALPGEADYFLLDFEVVVSAGTPVADGYCSVYKRGGGDAAQAPAPAADFLQIFVGNAVIDNQTGSYYLRGVPNDDPADTYYVQNNTGATLTIELKARGRTYRTAA